MEAFLGRIDCHQEHISNCCFNIYDDKEFILIFFFWFSFSLCCWLETRLWASMLKRCSRIKSLISKINMNSYFGKSIDFQDFCSLNAFLAWSKNSLFFPYWFTAIFRCSETNLRYIEYIFLCIIFWSYFSPCRFKYSGISLGIQSQLSLFFLHIVLLFHLCGFKHHFLLFSFLSSVWR